MNKNTVITWKDILIFLQIFSLKNDRTNRKTTEIVKDILENDYELIECDLYDLIFESDTKRIELWNANRFYSWLTNGKVTDLKTGEVYEWKNEPPSRLVTFKLYKLISGINSKFFTKVYIEEIEKRFKEEVQELLKRIKDND